MKHLALFLFIFVQASWGQLSIQFPVHRSVFQRVNNQAVIQIQANTTQALDKVQVRFVPLVGGTAVDWTTILKPVAAGNFRCQTNPIQAGWYRMELRGILNNTVVSTAQVNKMGVGEVFLIAGQSNAQGGLSTDGAFGVPLVAPTDDRICGIDAYFNDSNLDFPLPIIEKLKGGDSFLAPRGRTSWCYGVVGDRLTASLNMPVMFINAATGATKLTDWLNSSQSDTAPYIYLKKSLNYYHKMFGLRTILWHQGESDLIGFEENPQTKVNYIDNLRALIQKSRLDFGQNISWMICRVSRLQEYTSPQLIDAQNQVISTLNYNVFAGPETDNIQANGERAGGNIHFQGSGLIALGNAWADYILNPLFLNNSLPIGGTNNLEVNTGQIIFGNSLAPCLGENQSNSSGNWSQPSTWSCGTVPMGLNTVIINANHQISIENTNTILKSLVHKGQLNMVNSNIVLDTTD